MDKKAINYEASKTISSFHRNNSPYRGIMGPVGSGKSVGCVMEIIMRAMKMPQGKDGVRKSRWGCIRNSYAELKSTTIKTWEEWVPSIDCPIVYDTPIRGEMVQDLPDGTRVELEILFVSVNRPDEVSKLLSLELTGVWVNEARELDIFVINKAYERTGRYPAKKNFSTEYITECEKLNKPLYYSGLIMDTNPASTDHWWHRLAEVEKPEGWSFFRQPGALIKEPNAWYRANPLAENVHHQPKGYNYWFDMIAGSNPDDIKVAVLGEYGMVFSGRPVFKDIFSAQIHVSKEPLEIYKGLPIMLGFDFGLTPACVIAQYDKNGQLRILRELVSEYMAIRQFVKDVLKPALASEFNGLPIIATADPAGEQRSQVDARTCIQELNESGIETYPASTNNFASRLQSVVDFMIRNVGEKPAFTIDPSCKMIIDGFAGGYQYDRVPVMGQEMYKDMPIKNKWSHIMDAVQYLCLRIDNLSVKEKRDEKRANKGLTFKEQVGWEGFR